MSYFNNFSGAILDSSLSLSNCVNNTGLQYLELGANVHGIWQSLHKHLMPIERSLEICSISFPATAQLFKVRRLFGSS